jgi:hypothetical protein
MSKSQINRTEFIIIIIISLVVAFVIGFNIIQMIDTNNKNSDIKQIKSNNEVLSSTGTGTNTSTNLNSNPNPDSTENFGSLNTYPNYYSSDVYVPLANNVSPIIAGLTSEQTAEELLAQPSLYDSVQDPNFNNLNNVPVLISPDPPGPNSVPENSPSYYANRVKLIDNTNSPLLKLYESNFEKLAQQASSCNLKSREAPPQINGTFDGYNAYNDLRVDSYANVTGIGKGMLTPYTSFPVPS